MSNNFVQHGNVMTQTPAVDVAAGAVHFFANGLFGVALNDVSANKAGAFGTVGVWDIAKASGVAIAAGEAVYWDATAKRATNVSGNYIGISTASAVALASAVTVKLAPSGNFVSSKTNPLTGVINLSAGGVDAATLANPLLFGTTTQRAGKEVFSVTRLDTNAAAVSRPTLAYFEQATNPSSSGAYDFHAVDAWLYGGGSNANFTATMGMYAVEGKTTFTASAGQTLGRSVGVFGSSINTASSGTITSSIGVQGEIQNTGAGTTSNGYAFYAKAPTISAGTVSVAYGFYAQDIVGATNNFAIFTNAGRVLIHGNVAAPAGGAFKTGLMMSSADAFGVFFGSGAPTLSAAKGSLYMRTDGTTTNDRMYVNTNGTTGWTAVITAT